MNKMQAIKTQAINVTLYQRHIDIIDNVSCKVLADTRHNRSWALRHIVSEYDRLTALEKHLKLDRRPDTPYYAVALKAIEAIEAGKEPVPPISQEEIRELLIYGQEYETMVSEGLEAVQAYYDRLLARLAQQPPPAGAGEEGE